MRRQITPTARDNLAWINGTYGIGSDIAAWAQEIVESIAARDRPFKEVPLLETLDELEDVIGEDSGDWAVSKRRFREAGNMDKVRMIAAVVRRRRPPSSIRVRPKVFYGLSDNSVPVEVKAIFEIDLARKRVIFLAFQSFSVTDYETADVVRKSAENW